MSGIFAFTHWVGFKIPLTLRQALGERDFESLNCRFRLIQIETLPVKPGLMTHSR